MVISATKTNRLSYSPFGFQVASHCLLLYYEFTHSTSQVRARVKFESRVKFDNGIMMYRLLLLVRYIIHQKRYFPCQRDRESSLTTKVQDKQNISKTFEINFCQKTADKEKIEVTVSLQCLKGI